MPLQIFESVTSTMDVARENLLSGRVTFNQLGQARYEGVLAYEQTAGRGQRGRAWYAASGESLCATYYFRRGLTDPRYAGQIAFLAGVAVALALEVDLGVTCHSQNEALHPAVLASERCVGLKWPNDVLLAGKKVGGILIEMVQAQDGDWVALIGVGINVKVRAFPPELAAEATALNREDPRSYEILEIATRIQRRLQTVADLRRDRGFSAVLTAWRRYDQTPGRVYATEREGETVQGVAEGVDDDGKLLLRLPTGERIAVFSASRLQEIAGVSQ